MINYYEILEVTQNSTGTEIKRSFRRLAKLRHPDKNRTREVWAAKQMRLLLEAYAVLRDAALRIEYDEELRRSPEMARKRFWGKWERRRRADKSPASTAKLVLHYLLIGRAAEAVSIYDELVRHMRNLKLHEHMESRDYMDCMFLLAEECERAGRFESALDHYQAVHRGAAAVKNGYLHEEVRCRMRELLLKILPGTTRDADAHKWYERAMQMKLSKSDRAFVFKKRAECYARTGRTEKGREMLRRAFELKPNLKGAKKIRRILDF